MLAAAATNSSRDNTFFWSAQEYTFFQGQALCQSYGATLAVIESSEESSLLTTQLSKNGRYWIGLFNAAQQGGVHGSWVWANQWPYNASFSKGGYLGWDHGQPGPAAAAAWCAGVQWVKNKTSNGGGAWRWFADDCTASYGVLCEVQSGTEKGSGAWGHVGNTKFLVSPGVIGQLLLFCHR